MGDCQSRHGSGHARPDWLQPGRSQRWRCHWLALTTLALAAVGLSSNLRELRQTGPRPLALGALVWIAVAITSLALHALTGAL